jgi:drug/metabolite transporter (DMT)-like permease
MSDRKTVAEMSGEFFREAAVLTVVFIPLDRLLLGEPLTSWSWIAILGISGGSLGLGIVIERWRN